MLRNHIVYGVAAGLILVSSSCTEAGPAPAREAVPGETLVSEEMAWPDWVPPVVPVYDQGTIVSSVEHPNGSFIEFVVTDPEHAFDTYREALIRNGWTVDEEYDQDSGIFAPEAMTLEVHVSHPEGFWLVHSAGLNDGSASILFSGEDSQR